MELGIAVSKTIKQVSILTFVKEGQSIIDV